MANEPAALCRHQELTAKTRSKQNWRPWLKTTLIIQWMSLILQRVFLMLKAQKQHWEEPISV